MAGRFKLIVFIASTVFLCKATKAQNTFYDISTIQKIEIHFNQSDWDHQLDTAKYGSEGYVMAAWVKVNGVQFDSVGVKYKGNSSYDSAYQKNPIHIELDTYFSQSYQGYKDIKLGNGYADPSVIREALAYNILENYMDCPKSNFAQVYINGSYYGVYSNTESINKKFVSEHFYSSNKTFIKCNPIVNPGITTKCNLRYINSDSSSYFNYYEVKSNSGWNDLVKLCDTITNYSSVASNSIDMDRVMWMLAFNNTLVNLDSYSGAFVQNYYLYKDGTGRFNPIMWDLNMSFGGFPFLGSGISSLAQLSITNMQQLPLTVHGTDQYWPLIKNVMNTPQYKKMYVAHLRTITNEMFANNAYQTTASQLQATVDTAVFSDNRKFYTYTDFQGAMSTNVSVGSYSVPGISNLMSARNTYLQATTDFSYTPPVISNIVPSNTNPPINSTVYINASITNATSVYLGYRFAVTDKFTRYAMYDDGAHNDGVAGDNVFGAAMTMGSNSAQYYIYAENNTAGIFSPERAEHEFYTLNGTVVVPGQGQVVINEFLSNNQSDTVNEYSLHEDWVELYNTTNIAFDVSGLFLTDDYSVPTKFSFPQGFVIQPYGYLIVWADQNVTTSSYIHANFKLSNNGEELMLSNVFGVVLDSLTFGQQLPDISTGRCPNGSGSFQELPYSTFLTSNCALSGLENYGTVSNFILFPNPANETITIFTSSQQVEKLEVYTIYEQLIYTDEVKEKISLNTSNWASGMYTVKINGMSKKVIITH